MRPVSPYAVSKSLQDLIAQLYHQIYGLNIIITRMFTYNNPRRLNLFQSSFCFSTAKIEKGKQKILSHGNLNSIRTYLDLNDAINAYCLTVAKGKIERFIILEEITIKSWQSSKEISKFANKKSSAKRIKNCYVLKMLLYKYLLL